MSLQTDTGKLAEMWDCYQGLGSWASGNILPKHERESEAGYSRRVKGFNSPAIYRYLIDTFDCLYSHAPARIGMDDVYTDFLNNAGQGMDLDSLLNRGLKMGQVQGSAWLVMDTYEQQDDDLMSMKLKRTYPFLRLVAASDVKGLVVDELGRIIYFSYGYYDYDDTGALIQCYKIYTPGNVIDYGIDAEQEQYIRNRSILPQNLMPIIPIVPSGEPLRSGYLPASPTLGLYQGQYNIAATNSLIDESIYAQQFSVLVVKSNAAMDNLKLGTSNVLKLSQGDEASFISPSGTAVDLMLKRIDQDVVYMQKTFANLLTSGETQSGVAKVIDRQVGGMQLKKLSLYMQLVEYNIYQVFSAFMKNNNSDFIVDYYKDYDLGSIAEYITQAESMLKIGWSDDTKREIKLDLLKKFFSGADPELLVTLASSEEAALVKPETIETIKEVNNDL